MIGFGEAAQAFAPALRASGAMLSAFDIDTAKRTAMDANGVQACSSAATALSNAPVALSLVTADQALVAARTAPVVPAGWWFDMNSVAPDTKRTAATAIAAAGGRYADVAVMSPVLPARVAVPLLVSGDAADDAAAILRTLGFTDVTVIDGPVGTASSIKMIRSVMVKGIEALSAECALAAHAAGVLPQVIASLDASASHDGWAKRLDYNLDRMLVHGTRRAAEMREVIATLGGLGTGTEMTRGTVERQAALGALRIAPPAGLERKLAMLVPRVSPHCHEEAA